MMSSSRLSDLPEYFKHKGGEKEPWLSFMRQNQKLRERKDGNRQNKKK